MIVQPGCELMAEKRISPRFFERSPVDCARELIGCRFRWRGCSGLIVETEAYAASGDAACHTFFRPSARDFVEERPVAAAYVYLNYGVHWMFNILTRGSHGPGFVLFRALEPGSGLLEMERRRGRTKAEELCSGPGKLTQALGICGADHGKEFLNHPECGIFRGRAAEIVTGHRIGISRARHLPWRFGLVGSAHLSGPFAKQQQ